MRPRPDGSGRRMLMVASAAPMDPVVQEDLRDHVAAGRGLLLLGVLPERDLTGAPCRILADALGIDAGEVRRDSGRFHPSVLWDGPEGQDAGILGETRVPWFQPLHPRGATDRVLRTLDDETCGVEARIGEGTAVLLAAGLPSNLGLFGHLLDRLGAGRGLALHSSVPDVFTTTTRDESGGRVLHVLNVTGYRPEVRLPLDGEVIELRPAPHTGYLLARDWTSAPPASWRRTPRSAPSVSARCASMPPPGTPPASCWRRTGPSPRKGPERARRATGTGCWSRPRGLRRRISENYRRKLEDSMVSAVSTLDNS